MYPIYQITARDWNSAVNAREVPESDMKACVCNTERFWNDTKRIGQW